MIEKNFIQIAGVKSLEEAETLIKCGVKYIGFPLRLTVNSEDITEEEAKKIISKIKNRSVPILITYLSEHKEIIDFRNFLEVDFIQLHGNISINELKLLKNYEPNLKIIKSLIVKENNLEELLQTAEELSPFVDAFITDTFDPISKAEGATGKTHDWEISATLVKKIKKPIILAGGLNSKNVEEAILKVKPAGVDSHTGVENEAGDKEKTKVTEFIANAEKTFAIINNLQTD